MKDYSLVIASNFLDHYMMSMSLELKKYFKNFHFVSSEKLEENYKRLGFSDLNDLDFVVKAYEDKERARKLILEADYVLTGSYKYQSHIKERIKNNKETLFYSERLFKSNNIIGKFLRYIKYIYRHGMDNRSLLLCVSAYTASDYNSIGLFKGRTFKWGYFPAVKRYDDVNDLFDSKEDNSIIWCGRFIQWKHPENALYIAKRLKENSYSFSMKIIGTGEMKNELAKRVEEYNLSDCVTIYGDGMAPEQVRLHMEKSQIYLFTSDFGEGWGVVLNEAMNSACAVVASNSAGSTPFLIENGINGISYDCSNLEELYSSVKSLLDNRKEVKELAINAYHTISKEWNSEIAAKRLYAFVNPHNESKDMFEEGILSKAR